MKKNLESTKLKNIVEIIQKNCISKERKTNGAVFWKKHKKQIPAWILVGIQLLFFVFFPSAFTAAFSGVKYIAGQMGTGAQIEITSFVLSLIILCASTVVFGRFFCGFACAFGSLSDWVRAAYVWVCKKLKKKLVTLGMELTAAVRGMSFPCFMQEILHWKDILRESSCSFSSCVHVRAGAFFLPYFVPDGSDIFTSSGTAIFCAQKRKGELYLWLCSMHEKMSLGYRTAGTGVD